MTATMAPPTYSSADVCHQTGLTYRQVDRWCRDGYLQPRWRDGWEGGSGHLRLFDADELDRARMMARLVAFGLEVYQAAKIARTPSYRWRWLADVMAACKAMEP